MQISKSRKIKHVNQKQKEAQNIGSAMNSIVDMREETEVVRRYNVNETT